MDLIADRLHRTMIDQKETSSRLRKEVSGRTRDGIENRTRLKPIESENQKSVNIELFCRECDFEGNTPSKKRENGFHPFQEFWEQRTPRDSSAKGSNESDGTLDKTAIAFLMPIRFCQYFSVGLIFDGDDEDGSKSIAQILIKRWNGLTSVDRGKNHMFDQHRVPAYIEVDFKHAKRWKCSFKIDFVWPTEEKSRSNKDERNEALMVSIGSGLIGNRKDIFFPYLVVWNLQRVQADRKFKR
jgi:hypothetical protein